MFQIDIDTSDKEPITPEVVEQTNRKFTFEEILQVEVEENFSMANIDVASLFGGIVYYTDKKEFFGRIQSHSIDVIITQDPTVHNLNMMLDSLNFQSTIIIYDVARMMESEDDEARRTRNFLDRNGYNPSKNGVIEGVSVYEWIKGDGKSYCDTCIKELNADIIGMILAGSVEFDTTMLVDTPLLPSVIYYGEKNNRNILCVTQFTEATVIQLGTYYDNKEEEMASKVNSVTAQFEMF